jgi:hypothetical protein
MAQLQAPSNPSNVYDFNRSAVQVMIASDELQQTFPSAASRGECSQKAALKLAHMPLIQYASLYLLCQERVQLAAEYVPFQFLTTLQERKGRNKDKWLSNFLLILLFFSSLHLLLQVSDASDMLQQRFSSTPLVDTSDRYQIPHGPY